MNLRLKEKYIRQCIKIAKNGMGRVSPNPLVGSLLVIDNQIIGEGWHEEYGGPHAEINALASVPHELKGKIKDSSLFISLEPCNIFGRTPPCTDAIINNGIKKVFVSTNDPNPSMNGKSISLLKQNGIKVETGILQAEGNHLIRFFSTYHTKKRPFITIKMAVSKDGYVGNGLKSIWISDPINKYFTHKLRAEHDAIMVGTNTAIVDNPHLTTRKYPGTNPIRIIVDRSLKVDSTANVFDDEAQTIIFTSLDVSGTASNRYIQIPAEDFSLTNIIEKLYEMGIQSILLEGGSKLVDSFISVDLWDEAIYC